MNLLDSVHTKTFDIQKTPTAAWSGGMEQIHTCIREQLHAMKKGCCNTQHFAAADNAATLLNQFHSSLPSNVKLATKALCNKKSPIELLMDVFWDARAARTFFYEVVLTTITQSLNRLWENLIYLVRYRKDIQREQLTQTLSALKYDAVISPVEYTSLISNFNNDKIDALFQKTLAIGHRIGLSDRDKQMVSFLSKKSIVAGFEFLHLLILLKNICENEEKVFGIEEKRRFTEAYLQLQYKKDCHALYNEIHLLHSKIAIRKWLEEIAEEGSEALIHALSADPKTFCNEAHAFFANILSTRKEETPSLNRSYIQELCDFFKKPENHNESACITLALQIGQQRYLNKWSSEARRLSRLIKKIVTKEVQEHSDVGKIEDLIAEGVQLWQLYETIFKNDDKGHICNTYYSTQFGSMVATGRKIEKQLTKLASQAGANERLHAFCNCHYAQLTPKDSCKWNGLPERIQGIKSLTQLPKNNKEKKQATLLSLLCTFGSGHKIATDTIIHYSQMPIEENRYDYHVRTLNVPLDVLASVDPIHNTVGKVFDFANGDWLYNFLLQRDRCDIIDFLRKANSAPPTPEFKEEVKKLLRDQILKEHPDLIVVSYSFHNEYIEEVAEELGRPLIHISTDFDLSGRKTIPTHPFFKMAVAADHPKMLESLQIGTTIKKEQVAVTGPIVHPQFLPKSSEEIQRLRREKGIDDKEKVIVISSGGRGVPSKIPELLATEWDDESMPLRIVVIAGDNRTYAEHLITRVTPAIKRKDLVQINVYKEFIQDRQEMAILYHIADMGHGKPGGITSAEFVATGTPFLGDELCYRFSWEQFNDAILSDVGLGDAITATHSNEEIIQKIKNVLKKGKVYSPYFHTDKTPAQKHAALMSHLLEEAALNEDFSRQKKRWDPENFDLAEYLNT